MTVEENSRSLTLGESHSRLTRALIIIFVHLCLQRFGQGVMKYSNGDIYEGVSEYDLRSKCGKMTYKDGSEYEGSWENGLVTSRAFDVFHTHWISQDSLR